MSTASKAIFGLCCVASVGIIGYVHYKQAYDRYRYYITIFKQSTIALRAVLHFRQQLHLGVIRDIEQRERRKAENLYVLQQQVELAKEVRRKGLIRENDT